MNHVSAEMQVLVVKFDIADRMKRASSHHTAAEFARARRTTVRRVPWRRGDRTQG